MKVRLRNFPVGLMRWRGLFPVTPRHQKVILFRPALHRIHSQPFIEWSVAPELAIFIPKTDPGKDPDECFSIVLIQMLDFAFNGFCGEKVNRHEWYRSCALMTPVTIILSR